MYLLPLGWIIKGEAFIRFIRYIGAGLLLAACQVSTESNKAAVAPPQSVTTIHHQTLTLDTHIDIPLTYISEINPSEETDLQVDLPKLQAGSLDSGFWIVYTPQGDLTDAGYAQGYEIAEIRNRAIQNLVTRHHENFALAKTAQDVRKIVESGKYAVLIGMENAYPLGESVESIPMWTARGVRYMGITHFGHNQFGDSSNLNFTRDDGPKWNGLSPLGKDLVRALNDNGIMVDVSHAGKETMMQAADLSRTPVIASHSGVIGVADSARNLDDEQLRKIAEVDGVAQIVAFDNYVKPYTDSQIAFRDSLREEMDLQTWPQRRDAPAAIKAEYEKRLLDMWAIEPRASVADFVDHIDHAVKVAGIDHVGIASDFDGGGGVDGWEDASQTPNVTAELVKRGYNEAEIAKIWGGNLLRVMDAAQAAAQ